MKMVGGTGIIGQDMVCGFSNGKYTQFEGTEIVAENCMKAKVKDLVVEGKTIQDTEDLSNIESVAEREGNVISIANKGKNLINMNNLIPERYYNCSAQADNWGDSYNPNFGMTEYIPVKPNTTYFIRNCAWGGLFDKDKNNLKIQIPKNNSFITPSNAYYLVTSIYNGDKGQLEEGTVATSYEPYREPVITNINLPIPLRSLPDGTCDTIEGNKLVQRVEKVVFSGLKGTGLVWQIGSPYDETLVLYHVLIKEWGGKGVNALKCITSDKFATISNDNWGGNKTKNVCFMNAGGKIHFLVSKEDFPTSTDFDNYLKSNPTTIYYPLAEPIIHSLETPQLATVRGTNIITTTNNIKPKLSMKVKVK